MIKVYIILLVAIATITAVLCEDGVIKIDDVRMSELRRMSTGWMCKLSLKELERYMDGGKVERLFPYLDTKEDSAHVVTGWLACTLHACKQELLPFYPRENNERVYIRLLQQINTLYMTEMGKVDFVRLAMLAGCAARPEPAKAIAFYHNLDHNYTVPENSPYLLETLRLLRVAMHLELDHRTSSLSDVEVYRYEEIFSHLHETIVHSK